MGVTSDPIRALLAVSDGLPSARWNYSQAVGSPMGNPGGIGTPAQVTYRFLESAPAYFPVTGFAPFTPEMRVATTEVLAGFSEVANITFTPDPNGQLSFGRNQQDSSQGGFGYFPGYTTHYDGQSRIVSVSPSQLAGDVWLNQNLTDFRPGTGAYKTLIHEIGHAVGLKHPFEGLDTLPASLDNARYTVMSYHDPEQNMAREISTLEDGRLRISMVPVNPESLSILDIAALQHLYGPNMATHAGDDLYIMDPDVPFYRTIWDAAGMDTLSAENFRTACTVDLREGHFSTFGFEPPGLPAGYTASLEPAYEGTNNLAIAFGAKIENAIGGHADDVLIGNDLDNRLDGRGGADVLLGKGGHDVFVWNAAGDSLPTAPDVVLDFSAEDQIDLSGIDANPATVVDDAFVWIDENRFTESGQLHFDGRLLAGSTDGDGVADFVVALPGLDLTPQELVQRIIL